MNVDALTPYPVPRTIRGLRGALHLLPNSDGKAR
jgi:hypothetical protein